MQTFPSTESAQRSVLTINQHTQTEDSVETRVDVALGQLLSVSGATSRFLSRQQVYQDFKSAIPLVLVDAAAAGLSLLFGNSIADLVSGTRPFHSLAVGAIIAWTLLVQHVHGLFSASGLPYTLEYRRGLRTCLFVISGVGVGMSLSLDFALSNAWAFVAFAGALTILLPGLRSLARSALASRDWWTQPVLILGERSRAEGLFRRLNASRREGLRPLGIALLPHSLWETRSSACKAREYYVGSAAELETILTSTGTCRVAVADENSTEGMDFHDYHGIPHVTFATQLRFHPIEKTRLSERDGLIDVHCFNTINNPMALLAKRLLDLGLIAIFSPVLVPTIAALAVLVRLTSPGPIFYSQMRIGRGGKTFRAWKFRSMVQDADAVLNLYLSNHPELHAEWERDHKLKIDPRIAPLGNLLRRTSLDELPQIWNVLRREMSLVGPRPIVAAEIAKYGEVYELYTLVRPGITGLWQISGRNNTSYPERLGYDRYYVQNWSCMLDIYILYRTIKTALLQEGAY